MASITPEIVDPETTKIVANVSFKFNNTLTDKTKDEVSLQRRQGGCSYRRKKWSLNI